MHHHDVRHAVDGGDWRDIANEVEIELVVGGRIDRVGYTDQEQRITVRRRTHDHLPPLVGFVRDELAEV